MEEILDIYTRNGEPLGAAPKSACHSSHADFYHKPAWVWIINHNREILLQKRAATKQACPNLWDTASAGHVKHGETAIQGAIRETLEEIGLQTRPQEYEYLGEYIFDNCKEIGQIYLLVKDCKIEDLKLESDEVAEAKWANYDDFIKLLYSSDFVPLDRAYKEKIASILKTRLDSMV